jgi:hypothetical protein
LEKAKDEEIQKVYDAKKDQKKTQNEFELRLVAQTVSASDIY